MIRSGSKLTSGLLRKPVRVSLGSSQNYRTSTQFNNKHSTKDDKQRECPNKGSGRGFYYTVGAVVIGTGSVVAYAKHDPEFRAWLKDNVPGSDDFIAFVTAEQTSHMDAAVRLLSTTSSWLLEEFMGLFVTQKSKSGEDLPPCDDSSQPYVPPKSAFKSLVDKKKEPDQFTERRIAENSGSSSLYIVPVESTVRKASEEAEEAMALPLTLVDLEKAIGDAAQVAVKSYERAICAVREHAESVYKLVDATIEGADQKIWQEIKKKTDEREQLVNTAEQSAKEAMKNIEKLKMHLDDPNLPGGDELRAQAKRNVERVLKAVEDANNKLEEERARLSVTDKYWSKVQEARQHFAEELEILFPNVRLNDKNLKLGTGEMDLFIMYAFQSILYYQKELSKLDTIGKLKLKEALEHAKDSDPKVVEATVDAELEKERRKLSLEFQKRMLSLRSECERDMRIQMKRQAEAHSDHLVEAMVLKEKEMERKMQRKIDEQVLEEKTNFKLQISGMIGRLKGLDDAMRKRAGQDKRAQQSQVLWSACQSLEASLRSAPATAPWVDKLRPLQNEVCAISKAAAQDELVEAVVASIPTEAILRGVYTEAALRDRFLRLERVAQRVALLPDGGASLPVMLLSYLQALFIINAANPIPPYELANEPFEPAKLSTFDILQRARYWLDRGDLAQCLRYMNLLQGAPRAVAKDWIKEARILLETQQAAHTLMAHASASGLVYS